MQFTSHWSLSQVQYEYSSPQTKPINIAHLLTHWLALRLGHSLGLQNSVQLSIGGLDHLQDAYAPTEKQEK